MSANKAKLIIASIVVLFLACSNSDGTGKKDDRLQVVVSVFPLYDFATMVGGDKVAVTMLITPGTDALDYELTERDIALAATADVFMFVSFEMEQWAYKIINTASEKTNMLAVETGRGAFLLPSSPRGQIQADLGLASPDRELNGGTGYDQYIWLDFQNAQTMIDNIAAAFINKDPKNAGLYKKNAVDYRRRLGRTRMPPLSVDPSPLIPDPAAYRSMLTDDWPTTLALPVAAADRSICPAEAPATETSPADDPENPSVWSLAPVTLFVVVPVEVPAITIWTDEAPATATVPAADAPRSIVAALAPVTALTVVPVADPVRFTA